MSTPITEGATALKLENEVASIDNTENSEEDDLEIPAFLRRQKN